MVHFGNAALQRFQENTDVVVASDTCHSRILLRGSALSPCDQVKNYLNQAGISFSSIKGQGDKVLTRIGKTEVAGLIRWRFEVPCLRRVTSGRAI